MAKKYYIVAKQTLGLLWVVTIVTCQQSGEQDRRYDSMCTNYNYRDLSMDLKIEHQCLLIEQVQKEFFSDMEDRIRRYNELNHFLERIDGKLNQLLMDLDIEYFDIDGFKISKEAERRKEKKRKRNGKSNKKCTPEKDHFVPNNDSVPLHADCYDLQTKGNVTVSGVYALRLASGAIILAHCDMDTDGGGWTVIHRRFNGTVNFNRTWTEYKYGFGNVNSEFWLGTEAMHQISANRNTSLRVEIHDWEGDSAVAEYDTFYVLNEAQNYSLIVNGYHGDAGDSLSYHHDCAFSTPDKDNDKWVGNCAENNDAGWWFKACSYAALNNKYYVFPTLSEEKRRKLYDGILWYHWKEDYAYSLKAAEMKVRPPYL